MGVGSMVTKKPKEPHINFGGCSAKGILFLRVLDLGSTHWQRIVLGGGGSRVELRVEFESRVFIEN